MHDFFTTEDLKRNKRHFHKYLKNHPSIALDNSNSYFDVNDVEKDIILTHMFPIVKGRPHYKESTIVCICDKIVSVYEFFRYKVSMSVNVALVILLKNI